MTPNKPDIPLAGRYTTAQAVRLLELPYTTFRHYVLTGRIRQGGIGSNGRAYYTGRDLINGWANYWKV